MCTAHTVSCVDSLCSLLCSRLASVFTCIDLFSQTKYVFSIVNKIFVHSTSSTICDLFFKMSSPLNEPVKITWEVKDFANLSLAKYGPSFTLPTNSKVAFVLRCYVNYKCAVFGYQSSTMYLCLKSSNKDQVSVRYRISILNANGDKCETYEGRANCCLEPSNQRCYALCQLKHDYLMNPANGLLVDGKLIINCEVVEIGNCSSLNTDSVIPYNLNKMSEDYETLRESGKLCDAVLAVGEKELRVHKLILTVRSPVFAAMFAHSSTKEAQENRVEITDVDVEVLDELLKYIYTGKVATLDRYAEDLLVAADKYQMDCLKSICEQYLCTTITTESVSSLYLLADMYRATELNTRCIDYITDHGVEVMSSDGWKALLAKPDLLAQLFHKLSLKFSKSKM